MPHVIVKLYAGRSDEDKARLADTVTKAVSSILGYGEASISVAMEDVTPNNWLKDVYEPDIAGKPHQLFKKPGYSPADL